MVVRKYIIPILAVVGVAFAIRTVMSQNKPIVPAAPVAPPASSPYEHSVAGAGIIEASTRNIAIGTNIPGIVTKVHVKEGQSVRAGDMLFEVDARTLGAELAVRRAALASAERTLGKLKSLPRPEEVPPMEAKVAEAQAAYADALEQWNRYESISDKRAVPEDEMIRRKYAERMAKERLSQARADLALLKAGAWAPDLEVAQANIESARAQVQATQTEIERLSVRAPVDGEVLQLNVRAGEYAQAGPLTSPLVVLGNTRVLHVRCDIDENDAYRVIPGAKAVASLRGNSEIKTELQFVRIDPYVVPKKSLTGDSAERVDTRVLQVIYSFAKGSMPAYVGQQVDVKIEADARSEQPASKTDADPKRGAM